MTVLFNEYTVHLLTEDVQNPLLPYLDQRKRTVWYDAPVLKKGLRIIMEKRSMAIMDSDTSKWKAIGIEDVRLVKISPDDRNEDYVPSKQMYNELELYYERIMLDGTVDIKWCSPVHGNEQHMNKKEKEYSKIYQDFAMKIMSNLSTPIRDFSSVWLNGRSSPAEVLHRMFLLGMTSLDQIEAIIKELPNS